MFTDIFKKCFLPKRDNELQENIVQDVIVMVCHNKKKAARKKEIESLKTVFVI